MGRTPLREHSRRLPPLHQGTLEEALARLGLRYLVKSMFGGRCYYAAGKPFAFVLDNALALKLPATQLRAARARGDGCLFRPGGGEFVMRAYLELSAQALADDNRVDAYVQASYRFVADQGTLSAELSARDLSEGRETLYRREEKDRPRRRRPFG